LDPKYGSAYSLLGSYFLEVDEDKDRALKCFERSIQIDSSDEEAAAKLLYLYYEDDRAEDCILILKEVTRSCPSSAIMWRHLGFLYMVRFIMI
jgi:tetratricopeptide (TPR) repeat protein